MAKRAVDLSVDELGALGAKSAHLAVRRAQKAGLTITGTLDTYVAGQPVSSLAQVHPSGTVTMVEPSDDGTAEHAPPGTRTFKDAAD